MMPFSVYTVVTYSALALSLSNIGLTLDTSPARRELAPLQVTSNHAQLTRRRVIHNGSIKSALRGSKKPASARLPYRTVSQSFNIKVNIDGQEFELAIDTGLADTWVAQEGFTCLNGNSQEVDAAYCSLGPTYRGNYPHGEIMNENFAMEFDDGASAIGNVGLMNLTVAGLHVKDQVIGLVNMIEEPVVFLDNITSGVLGLAYSDDTSAFVGKNVSLDNYNITGSAPGDFRPYSPIFQTMISEGLNPPLFSLALQRARNIDDSNSLGGYIAFGGLPPVAFDPVFVTTPIEKYQFEYDPDWSATNFTFFTITPHGYTTTNSAGKIQHHPSNSPAIVDCGTVQMHLPNAVYNAYLNSIEPPPVQLNNPALAETFFEGPFVPCNSTVPDLGVNIAGTIFNVSGVDLILPYLNFTNNSVEYCSLAVFNAAVFNSDGTVAYEYPAIGATFLQNVVAVFDVGASVMRFASHKY